MSKAGYRPDIDGLRSWAILPVIFFHVGLPFPGGYVGVDVFFVISGFLITRLVVDEVQRGEFSFARFYERRARRLFPALFATVLATFLLSLALLSANNLPQAAGSVIFSLTSLSNVFFWSEAGYFDTGGLAKPLLHTWSLSVEEQFYLIWPALLWFLLPRASKGKMVLIVAAIGTLSLLACMQIMESQPSAAFYLTPFRVFEFAIGAGAVWMLRWRTLAGWVQEALLAAGLAMILAAVLLYTEETPFPGVAALLPSIGSALAIYAGQARILGSLLNNRLFVGIGRISYSMYLVHWPLVVFFDAYTLRAPTIWEQTAMIAATIGLATAMYYLVEKPFRNPDPSRKLSAAGFGLACSILSIALIVPAAYTWSGSAGTDDDYAAIRSQVYRSVETALNIAGAIFVAPASAQEAKIQTKDIFSARGDLLKEIGCKSDQPVCGAVDPAKKNVILLGDSHGTDAYNAFHTAYPEVNFIVMRSAGCPPYGTEANVGKENCADKRSAWTAALSELSDVDTIVLQTRLAPPRAAANLAYIQELAAAGRKVIAVGVGPTYERSLSDVYDRMASDENTHPDMSEQRREKMYDLDKDIRSTVESVGGVFIDRKIFYCPGGACTDYTRAGDNLVTADETHVTLESSKEFGAYIAQNYPGLF